MRPPGPMEIGQLEIGRARRSLHRLESAREIGCRRAWALLNPRSFVKRGLGTLGKPRSFAKRGLGGVLKPQSLVKRGLGTLRNPWSLTLTNQASVKRSLVKQVLAKRVVLAKQGLRLLARRALLKPVSIKRVLAKQGLWALLKPVSIKRVLAKQGLWALLKPVSITRALAKQGPWALVKPGPGASKTVPVRRRVALRRWETRARRRKRPERCRMDPLEISGWPRLERWVVRKRTVWMVRKQKIPTSRKPREAGQPLDWARRLER